MTNDGGNFYYFRCRPIRAARASCYDSASRPRCVLHTFRNSLREPTTTPLDKWAGVLLDQLFKLLPWRRRRARRNKDKLCPRSRSSLLAIPASISYVLAYLLGFALNDTRDSGTMPGNYRAGSFGCRSLRKYTRYWNILLQPMKQRSE